MARKMLKGVVGVFGSLGSALPVIIRGATEKVVQTGLATMAERIEQ